ncbi:hypothetical protein V6N12_051498 [Hibiscus sabdariffa]|uniref:Uncharacterized protein n=1 Tax=Hibiscus sabdariffa TaxID=183260 RepID=A0ABR2GHC6_9ROSI
MIAGKIEIEIEMVVLVGSNGEGKDVVNKANAFDEKHQFTSTATVKVASLDQKIGFTEKISVDTTLVNDKVREMDHKFQISEKTKSAFAAAEQTVNNTGSAIMKNRYILTGISWVTGAFNRVAKTAEHETQEHFLADQENVGIEVQLVSNINYGCTKEIKELSHGLGLSSMAKLLKKVLLEGDRSTTWIRSDSEAVTDYVLLGLMLYPPTRHSLNSSGTETSDPQHLIPEPCATSPPPHYDVSKMLPEGFLERVQGRVMICGWAPQLKLNAFEMEKELGLPVEMWLDYRTDSDKLAMADEMEKAIGMVMNGESEVTERIW